MQNFNQERLKLRDVTQQLQNQIEALQEDLNRYQEKENASQKYIYFKSQQIQILRNVLEGFNDFAENTGDIITEQQKKIKKHKDETFKLYGICLLHGISNVNYYLKMKTNALVEIVTMAFNEGYRETPFEIKPEPSKTDINNMARLITETRQLQTTLTPQINGQESRTKRTQNR